VGYVACFHRVDDGNRARPDLRLCGGRATGAWSGGHDAGAVTLPALMPPKTPEKSRAAAVKTVATNRKAFHDFFIEDRAEAGLVLTGTEVKSLRDGRAQLKDSYVSFRGGEAYLVGAHISPYGAGSWTNHLPERERKLLLHRREIDRWSGAVATRGVSCVPLSLYFKGSRAKAEIALVKGKKLHDKRDAIRDRDLKREADRAMRRR
jgi:SsrA-binding protein